MGSRQGMQLRGAAATQITQPALNEALKVLMMKDGGSGACRLCSVTRDVLGVRTRYGMISPRRAEPCHYMYIYFYINMPKLWQIPRLGCNPANHG